MKNTHDKEEYRRASAIKQKMEGVFYRTIQRISVSITVMCMTGLKKIQHLVWLVKEKKERMKVETSNIY
jgi:hypothetical protein